MCLIAFAWQAHPQFDLVLAGNRDELHARRTAALAFDSPNGIAGGRDLQAGGRWLGIARSGRVAAVTNVRRGAPEAPRPLSRGALVEDWLRGSDAAAVHGARLAPQAASYARFNLLWADDQTLCHAGNAEGWHSGPVTPGLHTLSNATIDTPWPKSERLGGALERALTTLDVQPDARFVDPLMIALQDRQLAADAELPDTGIGIQRERLLSAPFVALGPYGTRCSSLLLRRRDGHWWFIEQRYDDAGQVTGRTALHGHRGGLAQGPSAPGQRPG